MARVKGAMMTRKRRNKMLKLAKGFYGCKSKHFDIFILSYDFQGLCSDRPCRSKYCYFFHLRLLPVWLSISKLVTVRRAALHDCHCHKVNNRCCENHAVKSIQDTAVSRDQFSVIFNIVVSFDR